MCSFIRILFRIRVRNRIRTAVPYSAIAVALTERER